MKQLMLRPFFYLGSFLASFVMALSTGCASGGFKLTRQYAGFVNKQQIIIRIIVYLFTSIVFAVTMLIDLVLFNTMDFWEGKVSQGTYNFKKGEKTYQVRHEILPGSSLKRSTILIFAQNKSLLQEVVLQETLNGEIEMSVDGKIRAQVRDISSFPSVALFDSSGSLVDDKMVPFMMPVATGLAVARLGQ